MRRMANLQLWLSNGQSLQVRVDDADAEMKALRSRTGRFATDFVDLPGPVLGVVRTEAIIAVVIR